MIRLALVDPDPQFEEEIERMLEGRADMAVTSVAFDLNRALAIAEKREAEVMLIGPGISPDISIPFIGKLTAQHAIGCLLMLLNPTHRLRTAAHQARVVEVLDLPAEPGQIISAVKIAAGFAEQLTIVSEVSAPSTGVPGSPGQVKKAERKSTVITVFSTKGGVGKTVLATNIAATIAEKTPGRVALVDLDLQFGDVGIALGLPPSNSILDFVSLTGPITAETIDDMLAVHESGIRVLLAPKDPESADLISGESVRTVIKALKTRADFVIVDTPASFDDRVLSALDESDEVCLALTMDVMSIKNIRLCLRTLSDLRYDREKQKIVINRIEGNVGLKISEIEKALGVSAIAKIPADKAVALAINKGTPVVLDAPKLPVSREIEELSFYYVRKHQPDWELETEHKSARQPSAGGQRLARQAASSLARG